MPKRVLVLSGGGSKGAFQFGAEQYLREVKGYRWDIIAGVSVGALNGVMLTMGRYRELEQLWHTITAEQVYTGGNIMSYLRLIFGARSVYSNAPLRELIGRLYDQRLVNNSPIDLRVGAVSLDSGAYERFGNRPNVLRGIRPISAEAVLASTAIPVVWEPVALPGIARDTVDGGVRNISPLGDVLEDDPDEVVIINTNPIPYEPPGDVGSQPFVRIVRLTLDVLLDEIFVNDVREFLRLNDLVMQAETQGLTLFKDASNTRPLQYYRAVVISPSKPLQDTIDFSRDKLERAIELGRERARLATGG
ncbi:MAG: patatin-like phospholipase family protein [Roseiflexaceae bacterium]